MRKVSTLHLNNFKFFHGNTPINFNRNNILLYGENGSGKSSIYWALYTFLQSVFKQDPDIKKYFDSTNEQNLINRFIKAGDYCEVKVEFEDEHRSTLSKEISFNTINTKTDSFVKEVTQTSDFINYKLLSRIYDFSNKDKIDLFSLFEKEILMFINLGMEFIPGNSNANDWWMSIKPGLDPRPNINTPEYKSFQASVSNFNIQFESFLNTIIETSNEYLQQKFKQPFQLGLKYMPASYDAFKEGTKTRNHITIPPKILLSIEYLHEKFTDGKLRIERPQSFLNEARLTAIALSIRFAVLQEKYIETAPKLLVLDDLLLSLDMSNRDNILEIILAEFTEYQLIIMTHDRMFYEMAKHKIKRLAHENWEYIEMYNSVVNKIPKPFITNSETYLEKAKKYFLLKEYDVAGNFLRKATESYCKDFLPRRMHHTPDFSLHQLEGFINQMIQYAQSNGLDLTQFNRLDGFRKFVLNPTSHDSYDVPKYYEEIHQCIEVLDELNKIEQKVILKKSDKVEFELMVAGGGDIYKFEIIPLEEVKLIKQPGNTSILLSALVNYTVFKNNVKEGSEKRSIESLSKFYSVNYNKSDKAKNADFWQEVVISMTGDKLITLKTF